MEVIKPNVPACMKMYHISSGYSQLGSANWTVYFAIYPVYSVFTGISLNNQGQKIYSKDTSVWIHRLISTCALSKWNEKHFLVCGQDIIINYFSMHKAKQADGI